MNKIFIKLSKTKSTVTSLQHFQLNPYLSCQLTSFKIRTILPIIPITAVSYSYHYANNAHYWRQLFQ
jgi:hypothetical protein